MAELQATLQREIPMSGLMGVQIADCTGSELAMSLPLEANHNHQQTAFAGSLNALCTLVGWGTTFLQLLRLGLEGNVVIRRSSIRYHEPVATDLITAKCQPINPEMLSHFVEMLVEKRQAKLDLQVVISGTDQPAVSFSGSYVVLNSD